MDAEKENFLRNEFLTMSLLGALGRSRTYSKSATEEAKNRFRNALREKLDEVSILYKSGVTEEEHLLNIEDISNVLTSQFHHCLRNGRFRIGIAQKALNLYLKYLWCVNLISKPPHCPFDSIVIKYLPNCSDLSWTSIDTIEEYLRLVQDAQREAKGMSISKWELKVWTNSVQTERIGGTHKDTEGQQKGQRESVNGWSATSARFHDGFKQAMLSHRNNELTTAKIKRIVESTPGLADHSRFIYPSDHCINHTNKGACWCALTDDAIFERVRRGVFFIRNMV